MYAKNQNFNQKFEFLPKIKQKLAKKLSPK